MNNINIVRSNIKNKPIKAAMSIINTSGLSINDKYELLKEVYRNRVIEFDYDFQKSEMTFDKWVSYEIDEYVGTIWPTDQQAYELKTYINSDIINNYKQCKVELFAEDFRKIRIGFFKYDISYLLFEQILAYPRIVKTINDINEDEIWYSLQWLIYNKKISDKSLLSYKRKKVI